MICIDAEHLSDGLYNIKNGEIYKYKAKGGTVRTYKLERRPQGEWIFEEFLWGGYVRMKKPKCSVCKIGIDHLAIVLEDGSGWNMYKTADGSFRNLPRFCPNCGAKMKGADDE